MSAALVPIGHGRVLVAGLRRWTVRPGEEIPEGVVGDMDRRHVVIWSGTADQPFLDRAFGERPSGWRRRTLDTRLLALAVDGRPRDTREDSGYTLGDVTRRFCVPLPPPLDVDDGAITIAQLFLVLATRLEAGGFRSIGALLRIGGCGR